MCSSDATSSLDTNGYLQFIVLLRSCLMVEGGDVSLKLDGALAGSLFQLAQTFEGSTECSDDLVLINKLAASVERRVNGPWLKPVRGWSRAYWSDQRCLAQVPVGDRLPVKVVAACDDGEHIVMVGLNGVALVHKSSSLEPDLDLSGAGNVQRPAVSASKGGREACRLVSWNGKAVRFWDIRLHGESRVTGVGNGFVGSCMGMVGAVAVSDNGSRVAADCSKGCCYIWMEESQDGALSYVSRTNFAFQRSHLKVVALAISRLGDLVVAVNEYGDVSVWEENDEVGGGAWDELLSSNGSKSMKKFILFLDDEKSFLLVSEDAVEMWNVQRKRKLAYVALDDFLSVTGAILVGDGCVNDGESTSCCRFAVCGLDGRGNSVVIEYVFDNTLEELSRYGLPSRPTCICLVSIANGNRFVVGCHDGWARLFDLSGSCLSNNTKSQIRSEVLPQAGSPYASSKVSLEVVSCVAVLPRSGRIVAGHCEGLFSLWSARDGKLERTFKDGRGGHVDCVDVSDDESIAVSAHGNLFALVWNTATWSCPLALEGHARPFPAAIISADNSQIVSADELGVVRVWDAVNGASLAEVETGLHYSVNASRCAISRDCRYFLWATGNSDDLWKVKVIDIVGRTVVYAWEMSVDRYEALRNVLHPRGFLKGLADDCMDIDGGSGSPIGELSSDRYVWVSFLEKVNERVASLTKGDVLRWRIGAVARNRQVELPADSRRPQDSWLVALTSPRTNPVVTCILASAEVSGYQHAALGFDNAVGSFAAGSIAAGWMEAKGDETRCAVIASFVDGMVAPGIGLFFPGGSEF